MADKNDTTLETRPGFKAFEDKLIWSVSLAAASFHLFTAGFGTLVQHQQVGIHWTLIGSLLIIANQKKFKFNKYKYGFVARYLAAGLICFIAIYQMILRERLQNQIASYVTMDIVVAVIAIVVALLLGFKFLGPVLPMICITFIAYTIFGKYITGIFAVPRISFQRVATQIFTGSDGMFGRTLMVPARFMLLYVFFGRFMEMSGAGQFLVDIAGSLTGRFRGGAAQAAIYSSLFLGTVSGSGHANVATTGIFTIPLMKKAGYKAKTAGAVEAVASSGGQIMPPVMGSAAFIMAEITGISYSKIVLSALLPAVLYYICLSSAVYSQARLLHIPRLDKSEMRPISEILKEGWYHAIPIVTIFSLVFMGFSPQKAVFWALCVAFAVMLVFNREVFSVMKILKIASDTAITIGPLALTCMLAGIVMCTINLSGFGLNITTIIQTVAGANLMVTLILTMLLCLLLGMGMPTSACYILLSMLVVPAMMRLGVHMMAAHLLVIYFGSLSSITPPVALSALTAANISGAGFWETGIEACKLALAGFVVPYVFVFNNELLLMGEPLDIVIAVVTAVLGGVVLGQATGGWSVVKLPLLARFMLFFSAVGLFIADPLISITGVALYFVTVFAAKLYQQKKLSV